MKLSSPVIAGSLLNGFLKVSAEYIVVDVTKMGITVTKVGLELTSPAFRASVLPLHHYMHTYVTICMPTCL